MATISIHDTADAVSSMTALRDALSADLAATEQHLRELEEAAGEQPDAELEEIVIFQRARTALLSGLASVEEVLGWVHLMAEKDPQGNELEAVRSLPSLHISLLS